MAAAEPSGLKRKITAIMAADVAEYSRLISEDEEETLTRLEAWRHVFDDFVRRAGGRIFNTAGDGVMCEFPSAVEATRCAIDIQESLRTSNMAFPHERQMHFRIGISIGDVVERDGDLLGDGVNIAARLQSLAEPGGICVSRNVHEAVMNKISVPFRDLGSREVKNLPHPVHAFQIDIGPRDRMTTPARKPAENGGRRGDAVPASWIAMAALVLAMGAAGYAVFGNRVSEPPSQPPKTETREAAKEPEAKPNATVVVTENLTPAQAFQKLAQSGGIVQAPKSAAELYHNARSYEARGETAAARRDYLAFAALRTDHLDPLLRLAALVRATEGRAGARELMATLAREGSRPALLAQALEFEGLERRTRLATFAEANPDYIPVHALMASDLSTDRQGEQTIHERRLEQAALARFLAAEREGRLVPFFLDQSVLAGWITRAQERDSALRAFFNGRRETIGLSFMRSNAGWMANIQPPEAASAIEYKLAFMAEFRATGSLPNVDPRSGKPMANPSFEMPGNQGPTEISVRYVDVNGARSPVTTISFDPKASLVAGMRDILDRFSNSWLQFGEGHNQHLLYYTHLVSYRCAIQKAEIGYNGDNPAIPLPMPACDERNPHAIPAGALPYLRVTPDIESATMRLTYIGGEISEVKTFRRK